MQGKPQGFKGHQKSASSVTYVSTGKGTSSSEKRLRKKEKEEYDGDNDDVFLIEGITVTKTMGIEVMSMHEGGMLERRGSVGVGMKKGVEDFV
jgi:hypothetical protein